MTADAPIARTNTVPFLAAGALFESMSPSLTGIMGKPFINVTQNIGSIVLKEIDVSGISKLIAGMTQTPSFSKMIAEQYASVGAIGQALANMHKIQFEPMYQSADLQKAMAAFYRSFTHSVSTPNVGALLNHATSLQGILVDRPDVNEFAAEFFEEQPELAESIEQLPFLITLSSADRKLMVWFFTVVVAIYVTMGLSAIGSASPDLHSILGDLGVSGMGAGAIAGPRRRRF
ncbi:hypothetical protein AHiyo8_59160 [Arthrobacter sp. Hiyo8]|nr:hypothetical protein AHiyo8_59160 [Arthrobacter sp. Hiyo8]